MLGAVHVRGHLTVLPGGRKDSDPRKERAARRAARLMQLLAQPTNGGVA